MGKFEHYSLNDMEKAYQNGQVTEEEVKEYLEKWNATPGRFTVAEFGDGAIRNHLKTPKQIADVRTLTLRAALKLEVKGMRRGGRSVFSIVKQEFGFKGTKGKVLEQLNDYIERNILPREEKNEKESD